IYPKDSLSCFSLVG
ncbi:zonular occludens toxin family protein, partial [Vibrio sp. HENC-03]